MVMVSWVYPYLISQLIKLYSLVMYSFLYVKKKIKQAYPTQNDIRIFLILKIVMIASNLLINVYS